MRARRRGFVQAELAILDEIDSGLDVDALRDVATAVNGLRNEGNAILMITHYQVGPQPCPIHPASSARCCAPRSTKVLCKVACTADKATDSPVLVALR